MKLFVNNTDNERQPYNSVLYYNQPPHQNTMKLRLCVCTALHAPSHSRCKHAQTSSHKSDPLLPCLSLSGNIVFHKVNRLQLLVHPSPRLPETHPVTLAAPRPASYKDHLISPDYFITDHTLLSFMIQS